MEGLGGVGFTDTVSTFKKKRSNTSRRPRGDTRQHSDYRDISSLSSTPPSENAGKVSSDENTNYGPNHRKKEINLNQLNSRASARCITEGESSYKLMTNDNECFGEFDDARMNGGNDSKRCSEGVLAPANWKTTPMKAREGFDSQSRARENNSSGTEKRLKKLKLKVGGVTRTFHTKTDGASVGGSSSTKSSRSSDAPRSRQKLILQDNSDDDDSPPGGETGLRGVPWKNFSRTGFSVGRADSTISPMLEGGVRKSNRVPKRRRLDDGVDDDDDDDDDEIRYLEKLKSSKVTGNYIAEYGEDEGGGGKQRNISRVMKRNFESKTSRSGRVYEDTDYVEELVADSEQTNNNRRKKQGMGNVVTSGDNVKKEMAVTTRQRALQTGKDASSTFSASIIEFPNGLPPAPPRKQKDKLSEVEQQLKKAEAAQRRRTQVEKAARESEAEAIRKILGQDSSRKKREDKIKKRQEELALEKAANAMTLKSDSVRWVMGPAGTVVTFPSDVGLPSIFEPKPCSYPPPRETCAGPSCTNPYKYRDSKSKLPLCSLHCYKAIHEKMSPLTAC